MEPTALQILAHRLRAHHLDRPLAAHEGERAAGACGLQNTPPGAWETALFNRLAGCTLAGLRQALYEDKVLVAAWSFRGAPVVFPTRESRVFLEPLAALPGEEPWIYTQGIGLALDFLGLTFEQLLPWVKEAARILGTRTVQGKDALDQALAGAVEPHLPPDKLPLWRAPTMYGAPDRQTVGGAAVSFLLRPCSFAGLVVFGRRQGVSPTFTAFENWIGHPPAPASQPGRALVGKFLHCYGPTNVQALASWLGASPAQAQRLWREAQGDMAAVNVGKRTLYALSQDLDSLFSPPPQQERLLLLGPHDPYLDLREPWDRALLLEDRGQQRQLWRMVGNPGAVTVGGRIVGIWRSKARPKATDIEVILFQPLAPQQRQALEEQAQAYGRFRQSALGRLQIQGP